MTKSQRIDYSTDVLGCQGVGGGLALAHYSQDRVIQGALVEASARPPKSWIRWLPICRVCCSMAMNLGQTRKRCAKELVLRGEASARAWRLPKEKGNGVGPRTCNRNPESAWRATSSETSRS